MFAIAVCSLFIQPVTTSPSPFSMASNPVFATPAGSSFLLAPIFVSFMPVNGLIRARNEASYRACDQYLPFVVLTHVTSHALDQIEGAGDVGVDHAAPRIGILIQKAIAPTSTCICQ